MVIRPSWATEIARKKLLLPPLRVQTKLKPFFHTSYVGRAGFRQQRMMLTFSKPYIPHEQIRALTALGIHVDVNMVVMPGSSVLVTRTVVPAVLLPRAPWFFPDFALPDYVKEF